MGAEIEQRRPPASVVLIVEDNDADADVIIEALAPAIGAQNIVHCARLAPALERLARGGVDVVLLDLGLPDATGLTGLHRVKAAAPDVPVLVLTGNRDERICADALRNGAQDYLVKGVLDEALVASRVRDALVRQRFQIRAQQLAEERTARAAAEDAQRRAQWLAEAGRTLCESLEIDATLINIERCCVPSIAAACDVELASSGHDRFHGRSRPFTPEVERRLAQVLRSGQTFFKEEGLPDELVVPMAMGARVLGALRLTAHPSRSFRAADRDLAEELGRRAALALENASLYQRARTAVALRDEFVSIASHELRTPLSTLQLQLQILSMKEQAADAQPLPREEISARLTKCLAQTGRLSRLVETLLDVSLIASGQIALRLEALDLRALVAETLERFRTESKSLEGALSFEDGDAVQGRWDRMRVEQVLTNLVTNGVKYGAGKPVQVRLRCDATHALLSVRDGGIGIEPGDLNRIFDKFERAAPSRNYSGLGLGLYVTRQIVEAHGGTVVAEPNPGGGSLFTVRLPRGLEASA